MAEFHDGHDDVPVDPDVERERVRHFEPRTLAAIAAGGMVGATARFKLAEAVVTKPGHFPWATFVTNVSGSFLLGVMVVVMVERFPGARRVRLFFATGVIGAYTTMSTFTVEAALLVKDSHAATASLYVLASTMVGLAVASAGIALGRATLR